MADARWPQAVLSRHGPSDRSCGPVFAPDDPLGLWPPPWPPLPDPFTARRSTQGPRPSEPRARMPPIWRPAWAPRACHLSRNARISLCVRHRDAPSRRCRDLVPRCSSKSSRMQDWRWSLRTMGGRSLSWGQPSKERRSRDQVERTACGWRVMWRRGTTPEQTRIEALNARAILCAEDGSRPGRTEIAGTGHRPLSELGD